MKLVQITSAFHPDWHALRIALWPHLGAAGHTAQMRSLAQAPGRHCASIAYADDGMAVGLAEVSLRVDYVNGTAGSPVAFLEGLYVVPAARRQGVARALLDSVKRWAQGLGCAELASDTPLSNLPSQAVHARLGFEETERVVFFKMALSPADISPRA